jgi:hypothetical protein
MHSGIACLAPVEHTENGYQVHNIRQPFHREPDFGVTSVNYDLAQLIKTAGIPSQACIAHSFIGLQFATSRALPPVRRPVSMA